MKCSACELEMTTADGCTMPSFEIKGAIFPRIPYGAEERPTLLLCLKSNRRKRESLLANIRAHRHVSPLDAGWLDHLAEEEAKGLKPCAETLEEYDAAMIAAGYPKPTRCHDCGVQTGHLHHPGCDDEECPRCHGQSISCSCQDDENEDEKESHA